MVRFWLHIHKLASPIPLVACPIYRMARQHAMYMQQRCGHKESHPHIGVSLFSAPIWQRSPSISAALAMR